MTDFDEIAKKIYVRWGATAYPAMDKYEVGKLLAISVGLGSLFNEDRTAERQWMHSYHKGFQGKPYIAALEGRLDDVLELVNRERNL